MWRRALLAAAAVSYLICVLIMSGMQKEDLDVSMLQKLQRYNVNFDDINNERIREQCSSRNNGFTTDDQKEIKDYVTTTEYKPTITTDRPLPSMSFNEDTVMNYLKTKKDTVRNMYETTTGKNISTLQDIVTPIVQHTEVEPKLDMDLLRRYIQLETQKKSFYKLDDNFETEKHQTTIDLKTNKKSPNMPNNVAFVNKILQDFVLKQQKILTTTEYTAPRNTIDIQNIYKQIDEIIANNPKIDNVKHKDMILENYGNKGERIINPQQRIIRPPQEMVINQNQPYTKGKELFESFYSLLSEINQFNNNSSRPFPAYYDNVDPKDKQRNKLSGPFIQNEPGDHRESTTHQSKPETESNQKALTPSLAKEIAETVKNVIIKDLRKELSDIYLKTTQTTTKVIPTTTKTTTETPPTTTSKSTTEEKDISIIDKFMDLYEQIKSLKQGTFSLRPNKESERFVNYLPQPIKIPDNTANFMLPMNDVQIIPETQLSISSVGNYNTKPYYNYNSYIPGKEHNPLPRTMQTNSVEIQPLAVAMSKPDSLIMQNIVVNTGQQRLQSRADHRHNHYSPRGNRYSDSGGPKTYENKTHRYSPFIRHDGYHSARHPLYKQQVPKQREDIIRFRMRDNGNSKLETDYYEKINFENNQNGVKDGNFNKHDTFNNRNLPRYHEKLERADTVSDGIPAISDIDMTGKRQQSGDYPSRYQLPLVDMKKGSSYNDSHFKNFLKTQQKVTDMLEKILANKSKANTPRSVETA